MPDQQPTTPGGQPRDPVRRENRAADAVLAVAVDKEATPPPRPATLILGALAGAGIAIVLKYLTSRRR